MNEENVITIIERNTFSAFQHKLSVQLSIFYLYFLKMLLTIEQSKKLIGKFHICYYYVNLNAIYNINTYHIATLMLIERSTGV